MQALKLGQIASITVRNNIYQFRSRYASYIRIPEFENFSGTVKFLTPTIVHLTTGDRYFPIRVIERKDIVGDFVPEPKITVEQITPTWEVKGSKGNTYTVSKDGNYYNCTCAGFSFRHRCKHVDQVKNGSQI